MKSFVYDIGTKVYFGPEGIDFLGKEITNYGKKVFMIYTSKTLLIE